MLRTASGSAVTVAVMLLCLVCDFPTVLEEKRDCSQSSLTVVLKIFVFANRSQRDFCFVTWCKTLVNVYKR